MDKTNFVPRTAIFRKVDDVFTSKTGYTIHSIGKLALALENMSEDEFNHHVTEDKNDFAAWLHHSCAASDLAEKIGPLKDQKETTYEVMKFVVQNLQLR